MIEAQREKEFKFELQRICENFNIEIIGQCCNRVVLADAGRPGAYTPGHRIEEAIIRMEVEK